jgi:hypothetical protein
VVGLVVQERFYELISPAVVALMAIYGLGIPFGSHSASGGTLGVL